ncbi:MAG TPA: helix-turn-helix domain-containing protein [Dokdonella sp.]
MNRPTKRREAKNSAPSISRTLDGMGVTANEELVYRTLLRREGLAAAELAAKLGATTRAIAALLRALESKGMVARSPDRVPRYFALPPDIAIEALIASSQRAEEFRQRQARAAVAELSGVTRARGRGQGADGRLVEILSAEATAQMFAQMHHTAQTELLSLTRRPMLISDIHKPDYVLFGCLERGVRCRALIDSDLLNMPGWLEHMRDNTARGEQCRIAASLPFKLVVADRRIAIIPLDLARPDGPVLLVRPSSLLDALCEVFELLWRTATPFPAGDDAAQASGRPANASLLSLLASGLNDKSIELELGISHRTLARRISELMKELGAATRCQLGWLAAQRAANVAAQRH